MGAASDGDPRHRRDSDRIAGRHFGRLLGRQAGDATGLHAADDDQADLKHRDRPGLRPGNQLGTLCRRRRTGCRLRLICGARVGLRDRRHRHADDRHDPLPRCSSQALAEAAVACVAGGNHLPNRQRSLPRRQHDETLPRRLVPGRHWRDPADRDADLEPRPPARDGDSRRA